MDTVDDSKITLSTIPTDPLLHILSFLNYKDLVSCSKVCRRLRDCSSDDSLWKFLCLHVWGTNKLSADVGSRREHFFAMYKKFGRYADESIYLHIKRAWKQLETYTQKHFPLIYQSLKHGLNEEELDELEKQCGHKFPNDLRCSYRIHNGQDYGRHQSSSGLLGSMQLSGRYMTEYMLPLQDAIAKRHEQFPSTLVLSLVNDIRGQLIALCDDDGFTTNEIFYTVQRHDSHEKKLDSFTSGTSYLQWFCDYAQNLFDGNYIKMNDEIYRFTQEPNCVATTGHIKVTAATSFVPILSCVQPRSFYHSYYITYSMDEDAPYSESCQLDTRHWDITDETGHTEIVDGPGVVGQHPVMKPGAVFSYTSCTKFSTDSGKMGGYFTFQKLSNGDEVKIACPIYHMKCLPYQTCTEREKRLKERQAKK